MTARYPCTCGASDCEACKAKCQRAGCKRVRDCSHVACELRRPLTAGPGTPHGRPRLADEHLPPDER